MVASFTREELVAAWASLPPAERFTEASGEPLISFVVLHRAHERRFEALSELASVWMASRP